VIRHLAFVGENAIKRFVLLGAAMLVSGVWFVGSAGAASRQRCSNADARFIACPPPAAGVLLPASRGSAKGSVTERVAGSCLAGGERRKMGVVQMENRMNQLESRLMVLEAWIGSTVGGDPLLRGKFGQWVDAVTAGADIIVDPATRTHLLNHLGQWKLNIEAGKSQPGI
jgi:hypothetical protein